MIPWERRPTEVANLFNPSFCAMVIKDAVTDYADLQTSGMPYALSFLILPIALHTSTRIALPKRLGQPLHEWLEQHPNSKVGFPARVRRMTPFTKEAIIFATQKGFITIALNGNLQSFKPSPRPASWDEDAEIRDCLSAAQFLGRWFASTGDISTVFRLWGVRP